MRYFENCKTCEDVKQLYKKYARDLHPDCNPGKRYNRRVPGDVQTVRGNIQPPEEHSPERKRRDLRERISADRYRIRRPDQPTATPLWTYD